MTRRYQVRLHEMTKQGPGFVTGAVSGYYHCQPRQKPHFCFPPLTALLNSLNDTIPRILLQIT
jgi:hypothetical protein